MTLSETTDTTTTPLPDGWAWTTLGEICVINPKVGWLDTYTIDMKVSFIPMAAVSEKTGKITEWESRPINQVWKGYTKFLEDDILFAKITPCMENGKVAIAEKLENGIGTGSTEFHVIRCSDVVLPNYIYHFVRQASFRQDAKAEMTGSAGQLRVPTKFLLDYPLLLPPLAEQQRIVDALEAQLSRLDDGIAALRHTQRKLKRYRAAILKSACEGTLVPQEADDEPASRLLERILAERRARWEADQRAKYAEKGKTPPNGWEQTYPASAAPDTTALPELPEGWMWASVESVSQFVRYGTSAKASEVPIGVPVLRMGNIQEGEIDFSNLKYLPENHDEFPQLLLEANDLLFNRTNSAELVGKSAVYKGTPYPCTYASYLVSVRLTEGCLPDFLNFVLNSIYGRTWIASVVTQQVGQANVSGSKLAAFAFPLPPLAEQERIVAEVDRLLSGVAALERSVTAGLKRAERLRHSLLRAAFTGQLVAQDPTEEPATLLLQRLRAERDAPRQLDLLPDERPRKPRR